ncbi:MAG: LysR family transcriptional regulator, partial [Prevotella sp.]|nr:LysR family transcriptional regulator [Prevotella sp.]
MELRQLKYFITSADTLNFTEAARQCFITQSTLSQQIKQLETELGVQLFERIGKRVFLTETGRDFLPYARQTVADADYGVQRIKDMEELKTGRLCIGTTFGLSALITDAIARFSEQYPEVHLEVMFLKQDELIDAVRERKVDFALTFEMMEKDDLLTEQPVKTYHLCAIVSDQNPLAQQATVSLRQLADYNICTPARGMNARRMFDSLTNKKGIELQPKLEINEIHTLLHLVRTGRWVAILVDSITHGEEGLCAVPLREAALPMPVVWLYPKDMYIRKAMQKFM